MTEYRGFEIRKVETKYVVFANDGEKLSIAFITVQEAQKFVDRHIRIGGK